MLGRSYHHKHLFKDAIRYYKQYLTQSTVKNDRRQEVVNDIKRCAEGIRHEFASDRVFLENMGTSVNSQYDDFSPVASPNVDSRIYFTSNRNLKVTDHFSDAGALVGSTQSHDCDMFATEIDNGAWSAAFPLNEELNSNQHEILQDFSEDGTIVYFTKGPSYGDVTFYLDSFNNEEQAPEGVTWNTSIFDKDEQLRGFNLFADSILIFSSNRGGGLGGYDLYICAKKSDGWTDAINLGPNINGPFDEITPFMALDGRTLYLSSNRLNSIGGHDVFKSRFNEKVNRWDIPQNLSMPINSAGDDVHFRLSNNGLSAHFNSDRKSGKGGQDLYAIYFKSPVQEQLLRSTPLIFYMVKDFQLFSESLMGNGRGNDDQIPEMLESEWDLTSILYREDDQILTEKNKPKLDLLAGFLKTYPHLKLEILSHSDQSAVSNFDLFFSTKRAEEAAEYLIANGISPDIISIKGFGGSYPYALNLIKGKDNKAGRFFNRRLDFQLTGTDKLPLKINQVLPTIAEAQMDGALPSFYDRRRALYYRIEFATLDQLFKGDLIGRYPDPAIEKSIGKTNYHYTSGIFSSFAKALKHLAEIKAEGFDSASIIPYVTGQRLTPKEIEEDLLTQYPDLKEFVLYQK